MWSLAPLRQVSRSINTQAASSIPAPRGQITDVQSFLKTIGRGCDEFSSKFETWESLFTTNSRVMKTDLAIPTKQRKYILGWLEHYRKGAELKAIGVSKKKK